MRKVLAVLWLVVWLIGSAALMTHVTERHPLWIPVGFIGCLCIGFVVSGLFGFIAPVQEKAP